MEDGLLLLELAGMPSAFAPTDSNEEKQLLNLLLSNGEWNRGEVRANFRQPFDLRIDSAAAATSNEPPG